MFLHVVDYSETDSMHVRSTFSRAGPQGLRALTYRLERIHTFTGADPTNPVNPYALQTAVIGARLLGWSGEAGA